MAKILANINYVGSIGALSQYSVAVTSGSLPTWITSQNPIYTNLPSEPLVVSWPGDNSLGSCFISDYTNSTNFQISQVLPSATKGYNRTLSTTNTISASSLSRTDPVYISTNGSSALMTFSGTSFSDLLKVKDSIRVEPITYSGSSSGYMSGVISSISGTDVTVSGQSLSGSNPLEGYDWVMYTAGFPHPGAPLSNVSGTLITVAQYWDAGQANSICKIAPNSPPISGMVSSAAGNFGADGGFSVSLTNAGLNKSVWLFADTYWVASSSGSRGGTINMRNSIAVQSGSGRNLSNDNYVFYQRGTNPSNPTDFFTPSLVTNYEDWTDHYWPLAGGYCGNSYSTYLFSVARTLMNTYTIGRHTGTPATVSSEHGVKDTIIWVNNISNADPRAWNMQEIQWPFGERFINPTGQVIDLSDGFLYIMASYIDPTGTEPTYGLCLCRVPKNDIVITSGTPTFMRTELYMGSTMGWVKANWLQNTTDLGKIPAVLPSSVGFFGNTALGSTGGLGSVAKNSDGTFVEFEMEVLSNVIKFRRSGSLTGPWGSLNPLYYLPPNTLGGNPAWYYMSWCHPEQNWTGKATDDMLITVSNNLLGGGGGSLKTDTSAYWLQVLRVTGL